MPIRRVGLGLLAAALALGLVGLGLHLAQRGGPRRRAPRAAIPSHVETWAYVDSPSPRRCNGGAGATAALVRAWVTFAEVNCGPWRGGYRPPALDDCHVGGRAVCRVLAYVDPALVYRATPPGDLLAVAPTDWFAHPAASFRTSARRVTTAAFGGGYLMNESSPGYEAWWRDYVRRSFPGADGLFVDDQSPEVPFLGLSTGRSATVGSTTALRSAHAAISDALTRPDGVPFHQVDNTIQACGDPQLPVSGVASARTFLRPPVVGLVAEGCPMNDGGLTPAFPALLDTAAAVQARPHGFLVLLAYGRADAAYAQRERRVVAATDLLVFRPRATVVWPDLEQENRRLAIWPEEGLYPERPLQTMRRPVCAGSTPCAAGGHADLAAPGAPGVFRREFAACGVRGRPIGPCAAVVNTTGRPLVVPRRWLSRPYRFEMTFTVRPGTTGDVQSVGRLDLAGRPFIPGRSRVGPQDALLLDTGARG